IGNKFELKKAFCFFIFKKNFLKFKSFNV
ncbi:uncharacterized protein METZ01_LOCUS427707, partial [marine metagenome]